jgi:hypothetical protein
LSRISRLAGPPAKLLFVPSGQMTVQSKLSLRVRVSKELSNQASGPLPPTRFSFVLSHAVVQTMARSSWQVYPFWESGPPRFSQEEGPWLVT